MPPDHALSTSEPARERGASTVEYVGLGAVSGMLVTGLASAFDSSVGDRLGAVIVRRLLVAISGADAS